MYDYKDLKPKRTYVVVGLDHKYTSLQFVKMFVKFTQTLDNLHFIAYNLIIHLVVRLCPNKVKGRCSKQLVLEICQKPTAFSLTLICK